MGVLSAAPPGATLPAPTRPLPRGSVHQRVSKLTIHFYVFQLGQDIYLA